MAAEGVAAAQAHARATGSAAEAQPQKINAFELITLCGGLNFMPMFAGVIS